MQWQGKLAAVALEATNGWRRVARQLEQGGFDVRLVDPGRASALLGRRRRPKTDRLDARWLALIRGPATALRARGPDAPGRDRPWDQTRLRKALANDRTRWAQRLHALLTHEGWP
jgi:transposase